MPVHDWTKVDAATFHALHVLWIGKLMEALNQGVLPKGYYAMAEQVVSAETKRQGDVVSPCRISVRHTSGHHLVAVIEIVSPSNKDRRAHVQELADKIGMLLEEGISATVIDLLPRGRHDPRGVHGAVWARFDRERYQPPEDEPFALVSYRWDDEGPEAFVEPLRLARRLIDMPLFLTAER